MMLTTTSFVVGAIWDAVTTPDRETDRLAQNCHADAVKILDQAAATGWVGVIEAETVLLASGLGIPTGRTCETLALFGVAPQVVYRRPVSRVTTLWGRDFVSAADIARLLILLERIGFTVDPGPLCEALRPALTTRVLLTGPELTIYWYAKERHRCVPLVVATGPDLTWGQPAAMHRTRSGYRAELFRDSEARPVAIKVTAPRWRYRPAPLAA